jgi:hypothetical protein
MRKDLATIACSRASPRGGADVRNRGFAACSLASGRESALVPRRHGGRPVYNHADATSARNTARHTHRRERELRLADAHVDCRAGARRGTHWSSPSAVDAAGSGAPRPARCETGKSTRTVDATFTRNSSVPSAGPTLLTSLCSAICIQLQARATVHTRMTRHEISDPHDAHAHGKSHSARGARILEDAVGYQAAAHTPARQRRAQYAALERVQHIVRDF